MSKQVAIYAHRGASGYAMENTFEAFEKALALGADGIEIDIQRSKDGQYFVFHDLPLVRLTGVKQLITDCTAEEINGYRLGRRFWRKFSNKRIPLLEDVLKWAIEQNVPLNLELKESLDSHMEPLIALLRRYPLPKGSHVSSFFEPFLLALKQQMPHVEVALIVTKKFDWTQLQTMPLIDAIHANKKYYTRRVLKAVEQANKPIRFYNIAGDELFLRQPHPNVAGWITDYPDVVAKQRG